MIHWPDCGQFLLESFSVDKEKKGKLNSFCGSNSPEQIVLYWVEQNNLKNLFTLAIKINK